MTDLVLGPLLRHVGEHRRHHLGGDRRARARSRCSATPSAPAGRRSPLRPGRRRRARPGHAARRTTCGWTARWSGRRPGSDLPKPRIRTLDPDTALRIAVRLLPLRRPRRPSPATSTSTPTRWTPTPSGWPGCRTTAGRTRCSCSATRSTPTRRPTAVQERIRARRDISGRAVRAGRATSRSTPGSTHECWTDPDVRWLLSTIPSSMIFDDHDVRDDWNTSQAWRRGDAGRPRGGRSASSAALSSYWVYQHLGNLSPQDLADNELYQRVRGARRRLRADAARVRGGGRQGGRRPQGRPVVVPARPRRRRGCSSSTRAAAGCWTTGDRSMVSDAEFRWIEEQVEGDVRPPAGRHVAAVAAAAGAARRRVLERGARRRPARAADGAAGPRSSAGPPTSSTGRRSGSPSTGWPSCSAASGAATTPAPAASRPARSACSPATCTTPTRPGRSYGDDVHVAGLPADLLAGAQLRARRS